MGGKREYGFTLLELVIGIAVIAVMASFAVPTVMRWLPDYRLKRAGRALYSNLQLAKLESVRQGTTHAVAFDTVNGTYQILSDPGPNGTWDGPVPASDDTNAAPGLDGLYGTADDIPEKQPVRLLDYGSGVRYGFGTATVSATTPPGALPAGNVSHTNNMIFFSPRGLASNLGYVYLQNTMVSKIRQNFLR